jgi:hypothetical protein
MTAPGRNVTVDEALPGHADHDTLIGTPTLATSSSPQPGDARMPVLVTRRTFGIGFLLMGALRAAAAPQGWQTYTFPEDGFAIDLPAKPDVSNEAPEVPIITHRQYQADMGIGVFVVSAKRYRPDARLDQWTDDTMVDLANAMKGECRMRDGKPATFAGARSYEMVLDRCPGGTIMKVRMYVAGNRVYQLVAAGILDVETRPETQRFHDSFKLLGVKDPPPGIEEAAQEQKGESSQGSRRSRVERRAARRNLATGSGRKKRRKD